MPVSKAEIHRRLAEMHRRAGTPASRLSSIREIDAALRIEPGNPVYHFEKGLTRYEQRFIGDAERSLRKAAALDPGFFGAWYYLGKISREAYFKAMCWEQDREAALRYFRRANAVDGRHAETLLNLGLLALLDDRLAETLDIAASGERLHPLCERFPLLAGAAALRQGRFDEAEQFFARALKIMDETGRAEFEDVFLLLPVAERMRYSNLKGPLKRQYNRKFWVANDPTPSSETNERLLEHYRRVFLARELLSLPRLGLCGTRTARGETLVRYGLPAAIRCDLGPGTDGPFVIWDYETGEQSFRMYFQDEFLNGNYHIPIAPKYSALASITAGILNRVEQVYAFPLPYRTLPLAVQSAQTRGSDALTRIEFSIAVPDTVFSAPYERYRLALTFFDSELIRHRGAQIEVRSDTLAVLERAGTLWRLLRVECDLAPLVLESTAALEIWGGSPPARAVHRQPFLMRDYAGRQLALGDIRITLPEPDGLCGSILDPLPVFGPGSVLCAAGEIFNLRPDRFNRARYRVTYSIHHRRRGEPGAPADQAPFFSRLRSVLPGGRGSTPVISNTFERGTAERDVHERVAIDVSALDPGAYLLVFAVEDLVAQRRVSWQREFMITD